MKIGKGLIYIGIGILLIIFGFVYSNLFIQMLSIVLIAFGTLKLYLNWADSQQKEYDESEIKEKVADILSDKKVKDSNTFKELNDNYLQVKKESKVEKDLKQYKKLDPNKAYCYDCGAEVKPYARRCHNCGIRLK